MVSAMLTAIRDFAQDSFRTADHDSLEAFEVGELSVWIEQGPEAVIAAVIRGNAPKDFRRTLQDAVERVQLQFGEPLAAFDGDAQAFDGGAADPRGVPALRVSSRRSSSRSRLLPILATVVLLIALGAWALLAWRQHESLVPLPGGPAAGARHRGDFDADAPAASTRSAVFAIRWPAIRRRCWPRPDLTDRRRRRQLGTISGAGEALRAVTGRARPRAARRRHARSPRATSCRRRAAPRRRGLQTRFGLAPLIPGVSRFDSTALVEAELAGIGTAGSRVTILFASGTTQIVGNGATHNYRHSLPPSTSSIHCSRR